MFEFHVIFTCHKIFFNHLKYVKKYSVLAEHRKTAGGFYLTHGLQCTDHCPKAKTPSVVLNEEFILLLTNLTGMLLMKDHIFFFIFADLKTELCKLNQPSALAKVLTFSNTFVLD